MAILFGVSTDKDAADENGQSTDDDFVSQPKTKIPKVNVRTKKNLLQNGLNRNTK